MIADKETRTINDKLEESINLALILIIKNISLPTKKLYLSLCGLLYFYDKNHFILFLTFALPSDTKLSPMERVENKNILVHMYNPDL